MNKITVPKFWPKSELPIPNLLKRDHLKPKILLCAESPSCYAQKCSKKSNESGLQWTKSQNTIHMCKCSSLLIFFIQAIGFKKALESRPKGVYEWRWKICSKFLESAWATIETFSKLVESLWSILKWTKKSRKWIRLWRQAPLVCHALWLVWLWSRDFCPLRS